MKNLRFRRTKERSIQMQGKDYVKAAGLFFTGLTAGFLLAKHIFTDCCCGLEEEDCCGDKPPLHVKPVPITKKNGTPAQSSPEGETV